MKYFLFFVLFACHNLAAENIWIKEAGNKVIIGPNKILGVFEIESDRLEPFCRKVQAYLNVYLEDYERYRCTDNWDMTSNICNLIRKEFNKHANGFNDLNTGVEHQLNFSWQPKFSINWEEERSRVADRLGIDVRQVEAITTVSPINDWTVVINRDGFFAKALNISGATINIQSLSTQNRFLACAILKKEVSLRQDVNATKVVTEKFNRKYLEALYSIYSRLKIFWNNHPSFEQIKSSYVLLHVGGEMKKLLSNFPYQDENFANYEHWLDQFFTVKLVANELSINLNKFESLGDFEDKLYPPKQYNIDYTVSLMQEVTE